MRHTETVIIASSPVFTSTLIVQGHQRLNISIRPGSAVSGVPTQSTVSAIFTLQRKLPGEEFMRDVDSWIVLTTDAMAGAVEAITDKPEPETCEYQLGCKTGEWYAGLGNVRLGTS